MQKVMDLPYYEPNDPTNRLIRSYKFAAITIFILNALDITSTYLALAAGHTELNPLADFMIRYDLIIPAKLIICSVIIWAAWMAPKDPAIRLKITPKLVSGAWWVAGAYSAVVFMNFYQYFSQ